MSHSSPPGTPFSTPLSGSAKEAEARIRNLFSAKRGRPPLLILVLACALALLCGGLVSCEAQAPALSSQEEALLSLLAAEDQAVWEEGDEPRLLTCVEQGNFLLGAAAYSHRFGDTLLIGVMDLETGALAGPVYQQQVYYGTPYVTTFQQNGENYLLYTHNGMHQGLTYGTAGLVVFRGDDFTWTWPAEGDLREETSQAAADYNAYWEHHIALLAPGGVDVFSETDHDVLRGAGPQWAVDHNEIFYIPEAGDLPIPIPYQTRVWLEAFTRERSALSAGNRSALYHIVSMTPEEPVPGQEEGDSLYSLLAFCNGRDGTGEGGWLSAVLLFDQETGQVGDVLSWAQGDREEVALPRESWKDLEERNQLLLDTLSAQSYSPGRWYLASEAPATPQEEDWRIDSITLLGDSPLPQAMGEAYTVQYSRYTAHGEGIEWLSIQPACVVLSRSPDGSGLEVLGTAEFDTSGKTADEIVRQVAWGLLDGEVCLYRDGYSAPIGPGNWADLFSPEADGAPRVEIWENGEPIYFPGDYWDNWSAEGFTAVRYYHASEDRWSVQSIETTRTDLYTPRGARVGDSRSAVQNLYPELQEGDYWHLYSAQEEDFLWYCPSSTGLGPSLLFFFEHDQVSRIVMYDMFD